MFISINCRASAQRYLSLQCQVSVLDHDAAIHDDMDAASFGAGGSFEVHDSLLDPEVLEAELQHLVDDGGNEFWEAEDVDDVGFDRQVGEAGGGFFAGDFWGRGGEGGVFVA